MEINKIVDKDGSTKFLIGKTESKDILDPISTNISKEEYTQIIGYFEKSTTYLVSTSFIKDLTKSDNSVIGTYVLKTDGLWVWGNDLEHYFKESRIHLPNAFIQHIRQSNYLPVK